MEDNKKFSIHTGTFTIKNQIAFKRSLDRLSDIPDEITSQHIPGISNLKINVEALKNLVNSNIETSSLDKDSDIKIK